jgi:hypothetical protein
LCVNGLRVNFLSTRGHGSPLLEPYYFQAVRYSKLIGPIDLIFYHT